MLKNEEPNPLISTEMQYYVPFTDEETHQVYKLY